VSRPEPGDDEEVPADIFRRSDNRRVSRGGRIARSRRDAGLLAVVGLGGAAGSLSRYAVEQALPTRHHEFPWSTFGVNISGCLLLGVLMVLVREVWGSGRFARPFLGIGFLGGLTTYSAMMLETRTLGAGSDWLLADAYLAATLTGGLFAVWLGAAGTRLVTRSRAPGDRGAA